MTEEERIRIEQQKQALEADRTYQAAGTDAGTNAAGNTPQAIAARLQQAAQQARQQQPGGSAA